MKKLSAIFQSDRTGTTKVEGAVVGNTPCKKTFPSPCQICDTPTPFMWKSRESWVRYN